MPYFRYTGPYSRVYPEIMTRDGTLSAEPGDIRELENAPEDGYWAAVDDGTATAPASGGKRGRHQPEETAVTSEAAAAEAAAGEVKEA